MIELSDEDCPEYIRHYVRNNPSIEVYQHIRRGFNGEVYFGKRKKLGDDVVLKFYCASKDYDESEESVILQKIKHDNILEVKECHHVPPYYAVFITPKISGGDLQGIIDSRSLSSKESLEIIAGILLGLTELHSEHNLVHRDLKPGNILIDEFTNRPIIADLGAVKKILDANIPVTASKSTHLYLPPESIKQNQYYFESDIYQVGVILFQLLNGFFPINEPDEWLSKKEVAELNMIRNERDKHEKQKKLFEGKIIKGNLIDSKTLPCYLDQSFKRIINTATNLYYLKRYKNPSLFLKDIHKVLRECPNYIYQNDILNISHDTGKCFRIYRKNKKELVLEKSVSNNSWRKENSHNGTMESILLVARKK